NVREAALQSLHNLFEPAKRNTLTSILDPTQVKDARPRRRERFCVCQFAAPHARIAQLRSSELADMSSLPKYSFRFGLCFTGNSLSDQHGAIQPIFFRISGRFPRTWAGKSWRKE